MASRFSEFGMSMQVHSQDGLARISHQLPTAAAYPGMPTVLCSLGILDVLSSTTADSSVASLVFMPAYTASLRNLVRNAG